jgi:chorismate mutase
VPQRDAIAEIRANIERIDAQIVSLIAERCDYLKWSAQAAGNAKALATSELEHIVDKIAQLARSLGENPLVTERVYRAMIAASNEAALEPQVSESSDSAFVETTAEDDSDLHRLVFLQLTEGWNADLNAPNPTLEIVGEDLRLKFDLDAMQFPDFEPGETATLRFESCARYRLGPTNDEGWYRGRCRFSALAPAWGELYLIRGEDPLLDAPDDWQVVRNKRDGDAHFLFYFRENTFECIAQRCIIEEIEGNGLVRVGRQLKLSR